MYLRGCSRAIVLSASVTSDSNCRHLKRPQTEEAKRSIRPALPKRDYKVASSRNRSISTNFPIGSVFFGSCRFASDSMLKLILKRSKHCKNVLHSLFWCELLQISFKSLTDPEGPGVLPCLRHNHVKLGFFLRPKSISVHRLNFFIAPVRTSG